MDDLIKVLESVRDLGRDVSRDVKLGDFLFTLRPSGSGRENESYLYAESMALGSPEGDDKNPKPFQVTPAYVLFVKQHVVSESIHAINGVAVDCAQVVTDKVGNPREVRKYLLDLVQTWPSEVIDFMFMEYNKLQIEVGKKYGFTLTHRQAINALEKLVEMSADLAKKMESQASLSKEEVVPESVEKEADGVLDRGEPVSQPASTPDQGVLDQGDLG